MVLPVLVAGVIAVLSLFLGLGVKNGFVPSVRLSVAWPSRGLLSPPPPSSSHRTSPPYPALAAGDRSPEDLYRDLTPEELFQLTGLRFSARRQPILPYVNRHDVHEQVGCPYRELGTRIPGTPLNVLQLMVLLTLGLGLLRLCMALSRVIRAKWTALPAWPGQGLRAGAGALLDAAEELSLPPSPPTSSPTTPPSSPPSSPPTSPRPPSTPSSLVDGVGPAVDCALSFAAVWNPAVVLSPALYESPVATAPPSPASAPVAVSSPLVAASPVVAASLPPAGSSSPSSSSRSAASSPPSPSSPPVAVSPLSAASFPTSPSIPLSSPVAPSLVSASAPVESSVESSPVAVSSPLAFSSSLAASLPLAVTPSPTIPEDDVFSTPLPSPSRPGPPTAQPDSEDVFDEELSEKLRDLLRQGSTSPSVIPSKALALARLGRRAFGSPTVAPVDSAPEPSESEDASQSRVLGPADRSFPPETVSEASSEATVSPVRAPSPAPTDISSPGMERTTSLFGETASDAPADNNNTTTAAAAAEEVAPSDPDSVSEVPEPSVTCATSAEEQSAELAAADPALVSLSAVDGDPVEPFAGDRAEILSTAINSATEHSQPREMCVTPVEEQGAELVAGGGADSADVDVADPESVDPEPVDVAAPSVVRPLSPPRLSAVLAAAGSTVASVMCATAAREETIVGAADAAAHHAIEPVVAVAAATKEIERIVENAAPGHQRHVRFSLPSSEFSQRAPPPTQTHSFTPAAAHMPVRVPFVLPPTGKFTFAAPSAPPFPAPSLPPASKNPATVTGSSSMPEEDVAMTSSPAPISVEQMVVEMGDAVEHVKATGSLPVEGPGNDDVEMQDAAFQRVMNDLEMELGRPTAKIYAEMLAEAERADSKMADVQGAAPEIPDQVHNSLTLAPTPPSTASTPAAPAAAFNPFSAAFPSSDPAFTFTAPPHAAPPAPIFSVPISTTFPFSSVPSFSSGVFRAPKPTKSRRSRRYGASGHAAMKPSDEDTGRTETRETWAAGGDYSGGEKTRRTFRSDRPMEAQQEGDDGSHGLDEWYFNGKKAELLELLRVKKMEEYEILFQEVRELWKKRVAKDVVE